MRHARPWPGGRDPYAVLGVAANATRQEIVRAYHRAAHRAHPDTQPGDPQAQARFRDLTEAYDLLTDPARRADYDRSRRPGRARETGRPRPRPGGMIWAGPVHVEPPGDPGDPDGAASPRAGSAGGGAAADHRDPDVFLGAGPRLGGPSLRKPWGLLW